MLNSKPICCEVTTQEEEEEEEEESTWLTQMWPTISKSKSI